VLRKHEAKGSAKRRRMRMNSGHEEEENEIGWKKKTERMRWSVQEAGD